MEERTGQFTLAEKRKLDEAIKKVDWTDPKERHAIAETLSTLIYEDVNAEDLIGLMCDVETYELGQVMQFAVTRGVKAFVHEPGSYAPRSIVVKKHLTLYEEQTSVNLQLNLLELKSGRYGALSDLRRQMANELLGAKNAAVWNAFKAAIPTGGDNYRGIVNSHAAADKAVQVNALLSYINDVGAKPKAIVGRYSAIDWFSELTSYSEDWKAMRDREGFFGAYRGVPIIYLTQYQDGYGQLRIDTGDLFIIADGCGKFGIQLDNFVLEDVNADTLDWNLHITEIWGAAVMYAERSARLKFV